MKLPHVRQLQEAVWLLAGGGPEVAWLDGGTQIWGVYTVFAHFEGLALDSQHQISALPAYLPLIIDLQSSPGPRSEAPDLGVLWEHQRTPRRSPEDPQRTPRKLQERKK